MQTRIFSKMNLFLFAFLFPFYYCLSDESFGIILIPTIAKLINSSAIEIHVRGRLSSPIKEKLVRQEIEKTNQSIVPEFGDKQKLNFKARNAYFYTSAIPGKTVTLNIRNEDLIIDNPTAVSGQDGSFHFIGIVSATGNQTFTHGDVIEYSVSDITSYLTVFNQDGFSIVSDIDDTIKETGILWLPELVANTFLRPFKATPTLPEYFAMLKSSMTNSGFYYLSGMPAQFLPAEEPFFKKNYPAGEFVLPILSTATGIFKILDYKKFKVDQSRKIIEMFPERKLILFGDSTQFDPEAYADVYNQHGPDHVQCIFIRLVEGYNISKEKKKNDPHRFIKAFLGIPHSKWMTFRNTSELPSSIDIYDGKCRDSDWYPH